MIDILNGVVVHAVRGRRKEYQPLKSLLCKSVDPLQVAMSFQTLGFNELYIADLDAIMGGQADYQIFKRITETGLELMVDAGISDVETAEKLLGAKVSKLIIGTETLTDTRFIGEAVKVFGSNQVVVSLDLKDDKLIGKLWCGGSKNLMGLLGEFEGGGISQIIILDLARVGSGVGVNVDFLRKVVEGFSFDVYAGGGVRDLNDLVKLKELGVSGVLAASALHSGEISAYKLKQAGLL